MPLEIDLYAISFTLLEEIYTIKGTFLYSLNRPGTACDYRYLLYLSFITSPNPALLLLPLISQSIHSFSDISLPIALFP